jgi:hypothetical protein
VGEARRHPGGEAVTAPKLPKISTAEQATAQQLRRRVLALLAARNGKGKP